MAGCVTASFFAFVAVRDDGGFIANTRGVVFIVGRRGGAIILIIGIVFDEVWGGGFRGVVEEPELIYHRRL